MSPKALESRHSFLESCTFQLHSWRPFHHHLPATLKTLDSSDPYSNPTKSSYPTATCATHSKRLAATIAPRHPRSKLPSTTCPGSACSTRRRPRVLLGWPLGSGVAGDPGPSRVGAAIGAGLGGPLGRVNRVLATCSDFPVVAGTDSSGEMFVSGADANWASDASEANKNSSRRERLRDGGNGGGERDNFGQGGNVLDSQGNESGYGSEPGYRGDAEFGYGDEIDEQEDDPRVLFWGYQFDDRDTNMEMVGEKHFKKHITDVGARSMILDWLTL